MAGPIITEKPPVRPQVRPAAEKAESSKELAARRAAEIRANGFDDMDRVDEFAVPPPQEGWSQEWKRKIVINQEDISNMNHCLSTGWTPVPADRFPHILNSSTSGSIERRGMILMERPKEITDEVIARENAKARSMITQKAGQLDRSVGFLGDERANANIKVNKTYEQMKVPE